MLIQKTPALRYAATQSCLGAFLFLAAAQGALANDSQSSKYQPAGRPQVTISDMAVFPGGPDIVGASVLTRYNTFIEGTVSTTGLSANGAYSIWIAVFNRPEFCVGVEGCDGNDFPPGATPTSSGDPRVEASLLWGGGFVANGTGAAEVRTILERGKTPGEVRFGPGLRRPRKADIHIVLRSHGPAAAGEVAEQIGSFNGGCTPEEIAALTCPNANVQLAVHPVE
jgi:hypothetical protein